MDSTRTELKLFGVFSSKTAWGGNQHCSVSQTDSGVAKHAQDENASPAAVVALSPGHCYPQDVDVLKVIIKLSYQSMHKKLKKGYARNGSSLFVHLNCTFKKLSVKRHHSNINFIL